MPRASCNPLKRLVSSCSADCACDGRVARRKNVLQEHVGVWMWNWRVERWARRKVGMRVRRRGRRRERGSMFAVFEGVIVAGVVVFVGERV